MPHHLDASALDGRPHTRAELARWGVPAHQLHGPAWTRTHRGLWVHTPRGVLPAGAADRIRRAGPLTGERGAIGGWAAAYLHGVLELDGVAAGHELPVPVCLPRQARCRRTAGVRIVRSDLLPDEVVVRDGVRVTSPVRTVVDLARLTRSFEEAVVGVDALLRDRVAGRQLLDEATLWLASHPRRRGVAQARRVLAVARCGVESLPESRLRLLWVIDAGLPMPLVNPWLFTPDGELLGRADLLDPEAGVVGEYDGAHHAGAGQRSDDHRRRERLQHNGLLVAQCTSVDLGSRRPAAAARLRSMWVAGRERDRSRDHWVIGDAPSWASRGGREGGLHRGDQRGH